MVRKYTYNKFEIGDELVYNRTTKGINLRKGKVVTLIARGLIGVDFGPALEGHNLGNALTTDTGWECFTNQCYHIKEGDYDTLNTFLNFKRIIVSNLLGNLPILFIRKAYYYRLNNNKAMFGRLMKIICKETRINFKNEKGGKDFYGF